MDQYLVLLLISLSYLNVFCIPNHLKDSVHGVKMGILDSTCDDAKDRNMVDWDESAVNHTCYYPRIPLSVEESISYKIINNAPPKKFSALHKCMNTKIHYNDNIPMYGNHRPNWAVYGEYKFLPPQRWLHNLEHGAIILLYHPCVHKLELNKAKKILQDCIWKHVITASNNLSTFRPICFVAWGHRLEMNSVEEEVVKNFIKEYAHKAPEGMLFVDGLYNKTLITKSKFPQNNVNLKKTLCPKSIL